MSKQQQLYQFEIASMDGVVDAANGIVEGVSVITGGVQAKGHNLEVDDTTLDQMLELGKQKDQVPVKWNHKSGADAVNGYFTNFRREGMKLKADWHLLKSHSQYEQALELAERMPKNVGFSASFLGMSELADGTKVFSPDEKTKTHYTMSGGKRHPVGAGTKIFARCTDLISVDLVASPAANPDGMFEAVVDSPPRGMAENDENVSLAAFLVEARQFHSEVRERLTHLESATAVDDEQEEEEEEQEEEQHEEAPGQFGTLSDVINYFEARLDRAASDAERKEFEAAQDALEFKVGELVDLNTQLSEENKILATAYKELSAKTKNVVEFSAGADGVKRPVVKSTNGKKLTAFEQRVTELQTGPDKKSQAEAMVFAVEEDAERYQVHLQEKGAFAQSL
jgi:hypothetical protein